MEFPKFGRKNKIEYTDFPTPEERHDIYEFSKELSRYLHDEQIPNVMFLDRSARPAWVGLDEYWKTAYPQEKRPDIYFINPDGLIPQNRDTTVNLGGVIIVISNDLNNDEFARELKGRQFQEKYTRLEGQKDQPIAVFDTCMHFGSTATISMEFLRKNGFKDVRLVIADNERVSPFAPIPDASLYGKAKRITCYPFGQGASGVKKTGEVSSSYDEDADREKVVRVREEIREIIKNKGK